MKKQHLIILAIVILAGLILFSDSCKSRRPAVQRNRQAKRAAESMRRDSDALINAITRTLNNLPAEVSTNLAPPVNILDDSKSTTGQEVLATCSVTPGVPDSPFNYLQVTTGNAGFERLGVKAGDLVRYFVVYTQEDEEHGVQELTYIKPELIVRRLDITNPNNALIIEGGLNAPMPVPSRIEIWRYSDKRMNEINTRLNRYLIRPKERQGWEPTPDETALVLLYDRLNQWLRNLPKEDSTWQPETLVETLPEEIQKSDKFKTALSPEGQRDGLFEFYDTRLLQQAIWLRDISKWAKAGNVKDLEVAHALFDWTVRNIQLDPPGTADVVHHPWQALMYGHGTVNQRAWIFAELCRQQQLDVVMLSVANNTEPSRWWLPALLSEGKLYLFDTELGLPIAGEEPGSIATLQEVVEDPQLIRNLDLEDQTYPISEVNLQQIEAELIASPLQISQRAAFLQKELKADNFVVLAADNTSIVKQLKENKHIQSIELWPQPFQATLDEMGMKKKQRAMAASQFLQFAQRPRLWKARVLHFQGTKEIPPDQRNDPLAQADLGHEKATSLYVNPRIRPSKSALAKVEPSKRAFYEQVKKAATYWQGLLRYDLGDHGIAVHWLKDMTLEVDPDGPWSAGARYNLARAYEALGKIEEAIEMLENDGSPQSYGNQLRARQLRQQTEKSE